jgi:beta-N-acetylhexosaminidase
MAAALAVFMAAFLMPALPASANEAASAQATPSEDAVPGTNAQDTAYDPRPHSGTSLEVMTGQMLLAGFRGMTLDESPELRRDLTEHHLGGVILFDRDVALHSDRRNIESPEQLARLTASLRALARELGLPPPLIAVDQEGGRVQRLKASRGFRETPSAKALAARPDDLLETMSAGLTVGTQLAELGINLDFAPVLDVDANPQNPAIGALGRSFSASPRVVASHGAAFAGMLREAGVFCCVKHFPGHGSSATDSHLGLPDVTSTWTEAELLPFRRLIEEDATDLVMTGHLFNEHWDPELPASLSPRVVTGMLREGLGFGGVVVTDDLDMAAVAERHSLKERIRLAVLAGSDVLLLGNNLSHDPDLVPKAHAALLELVREGSIPEARIERSWARIRALKDGLR